MIAVRRREDVGVIEGRVGAHEQVVRFGRIEYHVECLGSRTAYRSGRQTRVFIGVVRRIDSQMAVKNTSEFEIADRVFDGRTGLEQHAFTNAVEVKAGNERHLVFVVTFAFDDRGYDGNLDRRESERIGFGTSGVVPESVVLSLHSVEELVGGNVPIDLVRVRDEEAAAGLFVEPVRLQEGVVLQEMEQRDAIHEQMSGHFASQVFACADEMIPCDVHGSLMTVFESLYEFAVTYLRRKTVVSFLRIVEHEIAHMELEVGLRTDLVVLAQEVEHGVGG